MRREGINLPACSSNRQEIEYGAVAVREGRIYTGIPHARPAILPSASLLNRIRMAVCV
jgi:hypothetical protein